MDLTLSKALSAGEAGLEFLKSLGSPVDAAKTVCGLGSHLEMTAGLSQKVLKRLNWAYGPPEMAALAVDAIAAGGLVWSAQRAPQDKGFKKFSELMISILKRHCNLAKWVHQRGLLPLDPSLLAPIESMSVICDVASSSLALYQNLYEHPPAERQLIISVCKAFKSYLLLFLHLTDNKEVSSPIRIVATGLGVIGDGYALFQRCQKIPYNPKEWTFKLPSLAQMIAAITLGGLAIYVIEIKVESEFVH